MKRGSIGVLAISALLCGCATLSSSWRSPAEKGLQEGLAALARADYRAAHERLGWVAQHYGHEKPGQRALLSLAAIEMDPRNPARRTNVGADLAGGYLRLPSKPAWTEPVAQTLYLLGLELAAEDRQAEKAEADGSARSLPALPGPSITARIRAAEQERDRLSKRVESLEKQLAEKNQELERIRKTIRQ